MPEASPQSGPTTPRESGPNPAPTTPPAGKFDVVGVATLSFGHFAHDTYPAFLGAVLPLLIPKHDLSLAAAGLLVAFQRWPSVLQPLSGYFAERTDPRYWVILAPTVAGLGMSLIGLAPNYLAIMVLLTVTGLASAAFHPAAGAQVTQLSGHSWGRGTSFFMTGGELGRAVAPLYIVAVIQIVGLEGSWIAVMPGVLASVLLYWRIGRAPRAQLRPAPGGLWRAIKLARRGLILMSLIILFRNLANTSFLVFFPTYVTSTGGDLGYAALAIAIFELAGAGGALAGGTLSDRIGRRKVLGYSQVLAVPTLLGALLAPTGPLQLALFALAGVASISGGPVQLVLMQELLPENRSVATGIVLFLGFEGAVFASTAVGLLADNYGLGLALTWSVVLSALSVPFVFFLPETHRQPRLGH